MVQPQKTPECYQIDLVDTLIREQQNILPGIEKVLVQSIEQEEEGADEETNMSVKWLEDPTETPSRYESLKFDPKEKSKPLELKEIPPHLKYVFLGEEKTQPAIISN
ncbi:hypothetical protein A2U01_0064715, partial [Trifolium medium]|nr:hypothetical protein [Trifolium medium]